MKLPGYRIDYRLYPGQNVVLVSKKTEKLPRGTNFRLLPGEDIVVRGIGARPTGTALPMSASPLSVEQEERLDRDFARDLQRLNVSIGRLKE